MMQALYGLASLFFSFLSIILLALYVYSLSSEVAVCNFLSDKKLIKNYIKQRKTVSYTEKLKARQRGEASPHSEARQKNASP